jgi:hypothetical protein
MRTFFLAIVGLAILTPACSPIKETVVITTNETTGRPQLIGKMKPFVDDNGYFLIVSRISNDTLYARGSDSETKPFACPDNNKAEVVRMYLSNLVKKDAVSGETERWHAYASSTDPDTKVEWIYLYGYCVGTQINERPAQ